MEPWIKFVEIVTKPVSVASTFVLFFATTFLLFAPQSLLARLGLSQALTEHRSAVGLGFIFSTAWVVVTTASAAYRVAVSRVRRIQFKREENKRIVAAIPQLNGKEKEILGHLLWDNQRMFTNTPDCGHAATLFSKGFVVLAARPGQPVSRFEVPFEIPEYVWQILLERKQEFPKPVADYRPWRTHWMSR